MTSHGATVTVVMPAFDAERFLARTLAPVLAARARGEVQEVLLVDDGSTDGTAALARALGAQVLESGGRKGPGGARNAGVAAATGDIVLFVDSDVVMHDDVPGHVRAALAEAPDIAAVYGSYDDAPPERAWASLYMNLRHHFVHQQSAPFSNTFWAGLGAVRRDAFRAAGGFDPVRYPHPSIEDIDLGGRLRQQGLRIRTRPQMQGTHLKRWTLGNVWFTDVFRRAIPWARLLLRQETRTDELNVSRAERLKAALAGLFFLAVLGLCWPRTWPVLLAVTALAWLANWRLFALFFRRGGVGCAVAGFLLHQCYYLYSTAVFLGCALEHRLRRP